MSSDRPSGDPSPSPEGSEARVGEPADLAALLRERGGPLLEALERHIPGSREHGVATSSYAFAAAVGLGFDRERCEIVREAAMLHDIGLIYVPAPIAAKPTGERTAEEAATWAQHYEAAYQLARGAMLPEDVCSWLMRVGEAYDGTGPERMGGERIPLESRLMRAACVCQTALATASGDQPPLRVATKELANRAGGELDPKVVAALITILDRAASDV